MSFVQIRAGFRRYRLLFLVPVLVAILPARIVAQTTLLGDTAIEGQRDSNSLGVAEAFAVTATGTGSVSTLNIYVDTSSTVRQLNAGLYADKAGHPGALLTQGSVTTIRTAAFNAITVPAVSVTSGAKYWIAILGSGSGALFFRDRANGPCKCELNTTTGLTTLPANWTSGQSFSDCPLSGYGSGSVSTTPILSVSPATLSFTGVQGGANPASANITITNTGGGTLTYNIGSDASWLSAAAASGTAPQTVQVSANTSGLVANTYTGHLTVIATGAQGSPATVTVTLTVTNPPPPQPVLSVSPLAISFTATQGGANPAAASSNVTNTGSGTLSFTTSSDTAWLGVSPASGNAPTTLQLSANIVGLASGTYTGHVTVTSAGSQGSPATITATLNVNPAPPPPPASAVGDWLMIDHDPMRGGFAPDESAIAPNTVANLKVRWSLNVDGQVSAQPLYIGSITVGSMVRDVVIIATSGNSLYALDANSGDQLWKHNFGAQPQNCAIPGGFGIFGAPLIDRATLRAYAVSDDGSLRTISLVDGTDAAPPLPVIANPATNKVWGGLNRQGNRIFFATASDGCDTAPWRGTIYAVDISGASPVFSNSVAVVPGIPAPNGGGGIWGYGGVSIDPATGNIYAATASDSFETFTLYGNRMVAFDQNFNVLGSFAPAEPNTFPCSGAPCDLDFGATPALFQPNGCSLMTAAGNKNGNLYLFKTSDLMVSGSPQQILTLSTADDSLGTGGVGGVPAFWPQGNMLFIADRGGINGIAGGVVGLTVTQACTLQVAWSVPLGVTGQPNSTPTIANGVVFVGAGVDGKVRAYNALTGAALWDSGNQNAVSTYGAPMIARGKLYFGSWNGFSPNSGGSVYSFAPDPFPGPVLGGDQTVEPQTDFNPNGLAEAFPITSPTNGKVGAIRIFVDATSTATQLFAGIYADAAGHPGTLLSQASINSVTPGAWITVSLPTVDVTAGTPYWIAVLGAKTGTFEFRDRNSGPCTAENSLQTGLTQLPATWSAGLASTACPISAYLVGIAPATPVLGVTPAALPLSAPQGQSAIGSINVANSGGGVLSFTTSTDSPWLTVSPASGTAPLALQVTANSSGLAQGTSTGHITVTSAGSQGSPATVTVNFNVQPPPPPNPILNVSPLTLSFSGTQGGANPAAQNVSVTNTGSNTLSFTAASDASWLSVSPTSGTAPQTLQISISLTGLTPNTYTGHITVTGAAGVQNSPATVTVTLTVSAPSVLLFGDTATESQVDFNPNGTAEAFQTTAVASGSLGALFVFIDASSTGSNMTLGVYSDNAGHPGTLLSQVSAGALTPGAFNTLVAPSATIVSGNRYWIAILGTGSGTLRFRDRPGGACSSESSAQTNLTTLPATWSTGTHFSDCPISAYGKTSL
jgi:hypothetical protein